MNSNIKIYNRKLEGEITNEEKNRIEFLVKQFHRNIERLNRNMEITKFKNKFFPPIILIMFLFTWSAIIVFIYMCIKSIILQWIIGLPAIIINGYVYLVCYANYLFQEKEEEEILNKNIEEILNEIDSILDKYNIPKEDFYNDYNIN